MEIGDLVFCSRDPFESIRVIGVIVDFFVNSEGDVNYVVVRFMDGEEEYFHPSGVELLPKTIEK